MPGEKEKVDETLDLVNGNGNDNDEELQDVDEENADLEGNQGEAENKEDKFDAKDEITKLNAKIAELTGAIQGMVGGQQQQQQLPAGEGDEGFKFDDNMPDYLEEPNKFAPEIAKKVYEKVVNDVRNEIQSTNEGNKVRNKFYNKYPEFKGLEVLAGAVGSQVEREMSGGSVDNQLEEVANRMHSIISNAHDTYNSKVGKGGTPGGRRTPKQKVSPSVQEKLDVLGLA